MGSFSLTVTKYYIRIKPVYKIPPHVMKSHFKGQKRHCKSPARLVKLNHSTVVKPKNRIIQKEKKP